MYRIQEAQLYTQANQHTSHSKGSKLGKFKKCKHWQSSETLLVDKDLIIIEDKVKCGHTLISPFQSDVTLHVYWTIRVVTDTHFPEMVIWKLQLHHPIHLSYSAVSDILSLYTETNKLTVSSKCI